jgi:hypothetical protein
MLTLTLALNLPLTPPLTQDLMFLDSIAAGRRVHIRPLTLTLPLLLTSHAYGL